MAERPQAGTSRRPSGPALEPFEDELRRSGHGRVAGLDEAGRGALFGPVVAAAAVLPDDGGPLPEVDDSKQLTPRQRRRCFLELVERLDDWAVGLAPASEVDEINVLQATLRAMRRAVAGLRRPPDYLLVDGRLQLRMEIPERALVGGDGRCRSIAAASILAKVARDTLLEAYARSVPGYGLSRNKGYGTREHRRALRVRGLSPYHRRSFNAQGRLPFDEEEEGGPGTTVIRGTDPAR